MSEGGGGSSYQYIDDRTVAALDAMIGRAVSSVPDGFVQVWMYAQIEKGRVRQVGLSPVAGESVRFADGGRGSRY